MTMTIDNFNYEVLIRRTKNKIEYTNEDLIITKNKLNNEKNLEIKSFYEGRIMEQEYKIRQLENILKDILDCIK